MFNKIMNIQQKLNVPKGNYNSFGKYKYRSCEDILEAVKPLLAEEGLILSLSDDIVQMGDRFYVKATATLTDGENTFSTTAFAREQLDKKGMDASQITGSCSSYARKYALNGLFCIDDVKDADTMDNGSTKATADQIKFLKSVYKGENMKKLLSANGIDRIENLDKSQATKLISKIKGDNNNA